MKERSTITAISLPPLSAQPYESREDCSGVVENPSGSEIAERLGVRESRLLQDTRGAVLTEYVVLVGAVGLVVASAIALAGVDLIHRFETARLILMMPVP